VRFSIRVRPGASRTAVGGSHDGALVVKVTARAVEGQANAAVVRALAEALGVPRRAVSIVSGGTSRTKVVQVEGGAEDTLEALLADRRGPGRPQGAG
jgi:uncharacterized protein (TIGR00251 family)